MRLCDKNENGFFSPKLRITAEKPLLPDDFKKRFLSGICCFWIRKKFFDFLTHKTKVGYLKDIYHIQLNKELYQNV